MKQREKYRHELKYYIQWSDYKTLSTLLSRTMDADANANSDGEYFIRSLYFDDVFDNALREKLSGADSREKIRIRIYGLSDEVIKLEEKRKEDGYICKQSLRLSREECERLISGDYGFLLHRREPFARRMFYQFATQVLRPVVIVDYVREAYTFPSEDVRITFDKNIRTAYRSIDLFNRDLLTYPATLGNGVVLEVKYNEYLPAYIRTLLQIGAHTRSAISKYVLCRRYEM
ncbi:MAG: polyphosphate polymerase domain-containing protein [Clostridia bacterium]|nr:polyphosphate polymerase domain-containing protein [Clostridia bacterium]